MNLKQINPDGDEEAARAKLVSGKYYLCGYVSSGDHPITWEVYHWNHRAFYPQHGGAPIDADETEMLLGVGIVLELPNTYVDAIKL